VIFSSKIIPGNEKKLYKLHNQLVKNGVDVVSEENEFVHVSGHPNREDLKDMYKWVMPKSVIPVHGEHRHMIEHINFAKEMQVPFPVQVENGDIVQLYPGEKPKVIDKAPVGRMLVDGNISVGEDSISIKERINISFNGILEITILINNKGLLANNPIISYKGIPNKDGSNDFVFDLQDKIRSICKTYSLKNFKQEQNLIDTLKTNCRKAVKEKTGKRPYTNINLVRI
jgi:ribonuclease J